MNSNSYEFHTSLLLFLSVTWVQTMPFFYPSQAWAWAWEHIQILASHQQADGDYLMRMYRAESEQGQQSFGFRRGRSCHAGNAHTISFSSKWLPSQAPTSVYLLLAWVWHIHMAHWSFFRSCRVRNKVCCVTSARYPLDASLFVAQVRTTQSRSCCGVWRFDIWSFHVSLLKDLPSLHCSAGYQSSCNHTTCTECRVHSLACNAVCDTLKHHTSVNSFHTLLSACIHNKHARRMAGGSVEPVPVWLDPLREKIQKTGTQVTWISCGHVRAWDEMA